MEINGDQCLPQVIALATVRVLQETMPPSVPGCMFLSGGMSEVRVYI
jgi:fructose-bisphosphate aldolase class 1